MTAPLPSTGLPRVVPAALLALAAASWGGSPGAAAAQARPPGDAVLQGRVEDARTGEAVPGARVSVVPARLAHRDSVPHAVTGPAGLFELSGLAPGRSVLRVEAEGFVAVTAEVELQAGAARPVRFRLTHLDAVLDELVVMARRRENRAEGGSVARSGGLRNRHVGVEAAVREAGPGVVVLTPSGEVGGGHRILVRGMSSFTLGREPAVFVDGVRLGRGEGSRLVRGARWGSPFEAVDPETIERIEVVRGAAAAARFGPDAADGVILIYTRRGGSPPS